MPMIQAKAREMFEQVKKQQDPSAMSQSQLKENFDGGKSWFYNFKTRTGLVYERNGYFSPKTVAPVQD